MTVFATDEQSDVPVDLNRLRALAQHVVEDRKVPSDMEVALLFVDEASIQALNAHHMGSDRPTDVLAFPIDLPGETAPGEPAILGDVVICPAVAAEQAAARDLTPLAEMELLVVHGILHLIGHDHAEESERREMFSLTDRLLADFRRADEDPGGGGS